MNKKGLSAVVTTLLIILLALVATGIVWFVVKNIVGEGTEGISFERFTIDLSIQNAYIDGENVKVGVRRSPGEGDVTGIAFIFTDGSDSFNVERKFALQQLEERTFTFTDSEVGGIASVQEVSIAPIYESSGSERIGDITDTAEIRSSPPPGAGDGEDGGDGGLPSSCGDGTCNATAGEDSLTCPQDCPAPGSCDGTWNPPEDSGVECDDSGDVNCVSCVCVTGYEPDGAGGCVPEASLSTGAIDSVWPLGAAKYFDSNDLPKSVGTMQDYIGKYVNFSGIGADSRCLLISYAEYLADPAYNKSYVRLDLVASISPGHVYEIWTSSTCGA